MTTAPISVHNFRHHPRWIKTWAYTRRELLFILWAVMEMMLIAPISLALEPALLSLTPTQLALGVLLLMLIPFYLVRLATQLQLPLTWQRNLLVGTAVVAALFLVRGLIFRPESWLDWNWIGHFFQSLTEARNNTWTAVLWLWVLVGVCWWRGVSLVARVIDVSRLGVRFRRGSLIIAPIAAALALLRLEWSILPFVLGYFVAGLTAVALTRAEQAERNQKAILESLTPRWLTAVFLSSLLIVLSSGLSAILLSGDSATTLGRLFAPLTNALRWAGATIGFTLAYLSQPFFNLVETLIHYTVLIMRWFADLVFTAATPPEASDFRSAPNEWLMEQLTQPADSIFAGINWSALFLLALVTAVIIFGLLLRRYYQGDKIRPTGGHFGKQLGALSRRLTITRTPREKEARSQYNWRDWQTAVSIIRIYEQMSAAAAELGHPRVPTETPYEYLATLHLLWPQHTAEINHITHAYIQARYGQLPESPAEFQQIKNAWKTIKQAAENGPVTHQLG